MFVFFLLFIFIFFLKIRRPPSSTRTDTLFPYTTLFRSIPLERAHGLQQGKRMQLVVVVQQGHVLSERDPESRVRCFCDMAIAVTRHVTDPRIRGGVLGQDRKSTRLNSSH